MLDPLQVYTVPQEGDGAQPSGAVAQVPTEPERLQRLHGCEQAELQQTPSTHSPEVHWPGAVQV